MESVLAHYGSQDVKPNHLRLRSWELLRLKQAPSHWLCPLNEGPMESLSIFLAGVISRLLTFFWVELYGSPNFDLGADPSLPQGLNSFCAARSLFESILLRVELSLPQVKLL